MKRYKLSLFGLCAVALTIFVSSAEKRSMGFSTTRAGDGPATHNMLIVGERVLYLSHLPMFQEEGNPPMPHRYQVILEATFTKQEEYVKDRQQNPMTLYMLNPERFVLPMLASEDPSAGPLRSFEARAIFRGHLEREGSVPILRDSRVDVRRLVHYRELDPAATRPDELEYILFGQGEELFLAHSIVAPPDFDQVLSVKLSGHSFEDEELAEGLSLFVPGTTNTPAGRLKAQQRVAGEAKSGSPPTATKVEIEVMEELYFEEGELRVPPEFESTPEERGAGFP